MASVDELWLIDFGERHPGEPGSIRPALVIGPSSIFSQPDQSDIELPFIVVVPLTTTYRGLPFHVELEATDLNGLSETSFVQCELIRSVDRKRLIHRLGILEPDPSHQVAGVIKTLLNY
ncbi:MAG: type II toxin-antitoxin system PemK/MazF family toxin [bacterium]|nr:type II toxin-antitoxin system PemK/MazF family toxin [bacterium]